MRKLLQLVVRRNAYFLLAAAWLFTISFVINNYWINFNSVSFLRNAVEKSLQKQETDFYATIHNISLLQKLADNTYSDEDLEVLAKKQYGVFLYKPDAYGLVVLHFWNTQYCSPTSDMLNGSLSPGIVKLPNGQYEFLQRKVRLSANKEIIIIGLIPVRKEYFIENPSLKREFVNQPLAEAKFSMVQHVTNYPVKTVDGNILFYLQPKPAFRQSNSNWLSLTIMLIGIVFLVIFINNLAWSIAGRKRYVGSIFFLLGAILILRSLTYFFPDLLKLKQYGLFNPRIYSSGYILLSLGDLLINSILFSWIVLFIRDVTLHRSFASIKDTKWHWPAFISMIFLLVSFTFLGADITRSLIADARGVSFNVTNFFSLDVYSIIGFLVLAIISFSYFFVSKIILKYIEPLVGENSRTLFLVIAVTGLLMLTVMQQFSPSIELHIYALLWLLLYVWLMQRNIFSEIYYKRYGEEPCRS